MQKSSALMAVAGALLVGIGIAGSTRGAGRAAAEVTRAASFMVKDVRVFDGKDTLARASVLVRDGEIVSVGQDVSAPRGVEVIDGVGRTLLPGLIDSHTHAFGEALERALLFGVTTELDMFTDHRFAARLREEQRSAAGAPRRADLLSAGTLVTAPGGHGTEYGMTIPTIAAASEAQAFVDARLAEGSDYIKIVYDSGASYGLRTPTIGTDVLRAVVDATRRRGRMAVVHIGSRDTAIDALAAGASGLIHIFADEAPGDFAAQAVKAGAFVTPTLTVTESTTSTPSGASLTSDEQVAPYLTAQEEASLKGSFPKRNGSKQNLRHAFDAVRALRDAGVPLLAGSDAPNPGTTHGASMHRELELLVQAGLTPVEALAAATSTPARIFGLEDRGRIAPGQRADLLLVSGDPTADIHATRAIVGVWKRGVRLERREAPSGTAEPHAEAGTGEISRFEGAQPDALFGFGWQVSTDSRMGGKSTADMRIVPGGANGSRSALEVTGAIVRGAPFPWAGAMFFPAATPMAPANLSKFKELVFWARGDGAEYQVMVFATRLGNIPASRPFTAGAEWREFVMPLASFSDIDGSDLRGLLFSASAGGPFRLQIDEVRLR